MTKSPLQILKDNVHFIHLTNDEIIDADLPHVIKAMQEYADQEVAPLVEENKRLKDTLIEIADILDRKAIIANGWEFDLWKIANDCLKQK